MPSHLTRRTLIASTTAAAAAPLLASCGEIDGPPRPPSVRDQHDSDTVGGDILIANALVFDGERFTEHDSVAVRGGLIAEVGRGLAAEDLPRFDAAGRVLLPGLIDAHAHRSGHNAHAGLRFGVTAMLDMYGAIDERGDRTDLGVRDRSDIWWAGWGLTVPGGHPTQWFPQAPTVQDAAEVRAFVAERAAEGSDYLKLLLQRQGPPRTLSQEEATAGVESAHDHGMLAVAHVGDWEDALVAANAGVDALVHLPWGETPDAEALELLAERGTPVVATLTVTSAGRCDHSMDQFLDDPAVAARLDSGQRTEASLEAQFCDDLDLDRWRDGTAASFDAIRQAGLPLLIGTDNGNPPVVTGVSMYHEMAMLAEHGLSTEEILAGATSATADVFGLDERGRIAADKRGDLLLLEATDAAQVIGSGAVAAVWKNGHAVELETRLRGREVAQGRDVAVRAEAGDDADRVGRDV
ncbi:amidohydrolase family protein [Glycomyces sp. NPDC049804]|uniref:amidohydrolase family protein n=1 Tax=Glycomyces sp. NPDC049804 TaxID=3154363 RepID=UPI0034297AB8